MKIFIIQFWTLLTYIGRKHDDDVLLCVCLKVPQIRKWTVQGRESWRSREKLCERDQLFEAFAAEGKSSFINSSSWFSFHFIVAVSRCILGWFSIVNRLTTNQFAAEAIFTSFSLLEQSWKVIMFGSVFYRVQIDGT